MNSSSKKLIVTGASGHIGYHVAKTLCERGFAPDLLVRRLNPNLIDLARRGARIHKADLSDPSNVIPHLQGADCLFHLAAENTTETQAPDRVIASTVGLTKKLLDAAVQAKVQTVVYTSSVVVLGRSPSPQRLLKESDRTQVCESPYVKGKVEAEALCEKMMAERGLDIRRVYPSWVAGPDDLRGTPPHLVINKFLQKGQPFHFSGGISLADVEEVARAHVATWLKGGPKHAYVLGGENISFQQFFTLLAELARKAPPRFGLPKPFIVLAAMMLKALLKPLGKAPPIEPAYARTILGSYSWYDSSNAIRELGYRIPPARETLSRAVLGERRRLVGTYFLSKPRSLEAQSIQSQREEMPPLLITGAPGWLGNRFIDRFLHGDDDGRKPPYRRIRLLVEASRADLLDLPPQFEIVRGDICDPKAVAQALEGIGTVFHLAGAIYPPRIPTLYRVNVDGTRNLVDQCIARRVRRVLYMSTDSTCGHGTAPARIFDEHTPARPYRHYGRSKCMAEQYVLEKSSAGLIEGTALRGFWFFGPYHPPRQQDFLNMMFWPRQLVFGNGRNFRSISLVDNTITAFLAAETEPKTYGKWYWIGDSKPDYTVDDIYRMLCDGCGNAFRPIHIPAFVCSMMRLADSALGRFGRLHPTIHGISKFDFDIAGRTDAAQRDFGYAPVISFPEYAARAYAPGSATGDDRRLKWPASG